MSDPRQGRPRYVPNTGKAVEVILWLANELPKIDIYHVVKAAFFADKHHIAKYGRPIIGDIYDADSYGPLPRVVYGLLCFNPLEVLAAGMNGKLPFKVEQESYSVEAERESNLRRLSQSDQEALQYGLDYVRDKSFDELYDITHADPAFLNADGGVMDYRDFIPKDDPNRDEKAQDIWEIAHESVF